MTAIAFEPSISSAETKPVPHRRSRPIDRAADDDRRELTAVLVAQRDAAEDRETWRDAVTRLVELHLPLARSIANRYRSRPGDDEDVFQVACLGLVKAVLRYDPSVGAPFAAFASPTIAGEVRRYFRDHAWDVRPPRHLQELRPDVDHAMEELSQAFGRLPSAAEVATQIGVATSEVLAAQEAVANFLNLHSLDLPTDDGDGNGLRDTVGRIDEDIESAADRLTLRPLVAKLSPRDQEILALRFVRGRTQRQIADHLGLSQTQVCRLLTRILTTLRVQLTDDEQSA
jgi:RNA polymerase sigma-B factor